jgi:signal peptidase I
MVFFLSPDFHEPSSMEIDELWEESINQGRRMGLRVASTSMRPLIDVGDRILVEKYPDMGSAGAGDIALFKTPEGWIVHRIISRSGSGESSFFRQKGDAEHHTTAMPASALAGRVVVIEKKDGRKVDLLAMHRRGINASAGRLFFFMDWLARRGARIGKDDDGVSASPLRIRVSGLFQAGERAVSRLTAWLTGLHTR